MKTGNIRATKSLRVDADPVDDSGVGNRGYTDVRYCTGSEVDTISGSLQTNIDGKSDIAHLHDDRYYTETEIDTISGSLNTKIDGKANTSHNHISTDITDFSEATDDRVNNLLIGGDNITLTYDDDANTLTISGSAGGGVSNHSSLTELDYASSGHTGFQPAGDYATDSELTSTSGILQTDIDTCAASGDNTDITSMKMSSTAPHLTIHNTTEEDTDYGRESEIIFKGEQSGGEETTLGKIQVAHDGTADDQKGVMTFKVNDGNDGDAPSNAMRILADGNVGIGTDSPLNELDVNGSIKIRDGVLNTGTTATVFGDSTTCGVGATDSSLDYESLVGASKGWTVTNKAISGQETADFFENIYNTTITSGSNSFALLGYNDMRHNGELALENFRRLIYSLGVWLSIPQDKILYAQDTNIAYTGTWGNTSVYGGNKGKYSSTEGSTATFTLSGSVLYIDFIQFENFTRIINIQVGGVDYGNYEGSDFIATNNGMTYAPYLIRIPNLEDKEHTIILTVGTGTSNAYFNWAVSSSGKTAKEGPNVYLGNCLRMNDYGSGGNWGNGNDEAVRKYNEVIKDCVKDLSNDGLNIAYVDANAYYNLDTDVHADGIHPNDLGYEHIADAFLSVMNSVSQARGKGLIQIDWMDTTKNFKTTGTGYFGGNVGIGTDSPGYQLVTTGSVQLANNGGGLAIGTVEPNSSYRLIVGNTKTFKVFPDFNGVGEIAAGAFMQTGQGDMTFAADSTNVGSKTNIAYYNGSNWYSALQVATVGSGYSDLLLMKSGGNIGIGTTDPKNKLDIEGSLAVGAGYSGTNTAPSNGAIIEGNVGIGTTSTTAKLDVNSDAIRVRTAKTPTTASGVGNQGDWCWDADYIYVCVATNTWKRSAISTW